VAIALIHSDRQKGGRTYGHTADRGRTNMVWVSKRCPQLCECA